MKLIEEQGKTMLMVTHDQELAGRIPRKIEIVNGRIASDGVANDVGKQAETSFSAVEIDRVPVSNGSGQAPAGAKLNGSYIANGSRVLVGA
jgi:ABC-type sulfate/molybdate transport systems ATPase subunit